MKDSDWFEKDDTEMVIEEVQRIANLPIVHGKYVNVWLIKNGSSRVYQIVEYTNGSGSVQVYHVKKGKDGLCISKEESLSPDLSFDTPGVGLHYFVLRQIKNNPCFPDELRGCLEALLKRMEDVLTLKEQEYRESKAILFW